MPDDTDKKPQRTPPGKRTPPRVAEGPPPTPEAERHFDERTLKRSSRYAGERSGEASKPYTADTEAYQHEAETKTGGDEPAPDEEQT